jgi:hypothetical protein
MVLPPLPHYKKIEEGKKNGKAIPVIGCESP